MFPAFLANIKIVKADVPAVLNDATAWGGLWQASAGRFLLDVPDVARYLVEGGEHVTIEPAAGASPDAVQRFAGMSPLSALLYQRGILALHAAAVSNVRGAILLAGDSGAGKSALLATLLQRGWSLISDDLAVVDVDDEGCAFVRPTFPEIALWPDSLEKLGYDLNRLPGYDTNRRLLSLPDQLAVESKPLCAIYWQGVHNKDEIIRNDLSGAARFQAVGTILYNSHIADALLDRVAYMRKTSAIAEKIRIVRLYRPRGKWRVADLADVIENELK